MNTKSNQTIYFLTITHKSQFLAYSFLIQLETFFTSNSLIFYTFPYGHLSFFCPIFDPPVSLGVFKGIETRKGDSHEKSTEQPSTLKLPVKINGLNKKSTKCVPYFPSKIFQSTFFTINQIRILYNKYIQESIN